MKLQWEAVQLLLYQAVVKAGRNLPGVEEIALAKLACNKAGFEVANEALQIMDGAGYSQDNLVEYCFRCTRGWTIASGSVEILRNRIAGGIFDRRFSQRPTGA